MISRVPLSIGVLAVLVVSSTALAMPPQTQTALREEVDNGRSLLDRQAGLMVRDVTLETALARLTETSGVIVAFSPSMLRASRRKVTCDCQLWKVGEALDMLLAGTGFRYLAMGDQIVLTPKTLLAPQIMTPVRPELASLGRGRMSPERRADRRQGEHRQPIDPRPVQGTIVGQVLDGGTQRPMPTVHVSIPRFGIGTVTSSDGRYELAAVPAGQVDIQAQHIGYRLETQTITLRSGETVAVDFVLRPTAIGLDEIVVTGTPAGVRQRALGTSMARVQAADIVERARIQNVGELIQGRAAGVTVAQGSGMMGGAARITMRGRSTLRLETDPLLYVDGVRVDNNPQSLGTGNAPVGSRMNDFNPEDIERIEIIRGPAAATLYGTEATNGVIHIITKRGRSGQATQMTFTVRQGASWMPTNRFPTNYWRNPNTGEVETLNLIERENPFQTGHLQGYDANVSGASDLIRFYAGVSFDRDQGAEPINVQQRFGARANLSFVPHPTLDIDLSVGSTISDTRFNSDTWGTGVGLVRGLLWASPQLLDTPRRGFHTVPPDVSYAAFESTQSVNRHTQSVTLRHRPTAWFSQRLTAGQDLTREETVRIIERMDPEHALFFTPTVADGSIEVLQRVPDVTTIDYSGTLAARVTDELASNTSVGFQYFRRYTKLITAQGLGFATPGLRTVAATASRQGTTDAIENATVGAYVQQEFGWNDRVFVTAAVRADDNSAFGRDFQLVTYPKLSATWVISEEPFWSVPFISDLKLRGAFGASGQQPDVFDAIRTFAPITGPGDAGALTPSSIGNPNLKPERGEELELGFDAGFLNDRMAVDFTYYRQRTKDVIANQPLAPSAGFPGTQFVNLGEVKNNGIELLLSALPVETRNFAWQLTVNASSNNSVITKLGIPGQDFIPLAWGPARHQVGYPVGAWFLPEIVSAELDGDGNPINVMCNGGPENNHVPLPCDDAPQIYQGRQTPKYQGGVSSTLTFFERLQLSATVDVKAGHMRFANYTDWWRCSSLLLCEENVYPERFSPERIASASLSFRRNTVPSNENFMLQSSDFARLQEVSLSYTLPDRWTPLGASRALILIAGRNLHTWTGYTGLDPDTYSTRNLLVLEDVGLSPMLRHFEMSFRLNF